MPSVHNADRLRVSTNRTNQMTIAQGIAHNKLKKLNSRRLELVVAFNRAAAAHRDVTGMYIRGSHSGCEYMLGCLAKVDAEIAKWKAQR